LEKKVRKAVRTILIENNDVLAIKYKKDVNKDYYDIPGGKIEDGENSLQASIREFKEETGIDIISQQYKGHVIIEYPERIYDFDVYIVKKYTGEPLEFEENYSMWKNIQELINESNIFPSIEILKYISEDNIDIRIYCDNNHKITKIQGGF